MKGSNTLGFWSATVHLYTSLYGNYEYVNFIQIMFNVLGKEGVET